LAREAAEQKKSREERLKKRDHDALGAAVTAGSVGRENSRRQTADASGEDSPLKKPKRAESGNRRAAPSPSSDSDSVSDSGASESDEIAATGAKPINSKGSEKLKARSLHAEKVDS
jgi:hypothetical protein